MTTKKVYIVHCVDSEGPLSEKAFWTLDDFRENYEPWKFDKIDYESDPEGTIMRHRQNLLGSWESIVSMLRHATGPNIRRNLTDSIGQEWRYSWFCMDHIDFLENPRHRAMGIHEIFDVYTNLVASTKNNDAIHWHFHPLSTYRQGHKCATSYLNSPQLYEILCRRLIERKWFPRANRAGFQDERPDSHWFLEQWIPFDFSNTASDDVPPEINEDLLQGRFSDWRWAPKDWRTYHPDHDHYQLEGGCRRQIARSLNVLNRFANLTFEEVCLAFERASSGKPTLLGIASHDWRDLGYEVEFIQYLLDRASKQFPEVQFIYSEAVEAMNAVNSEKQLDPLRLGCHLYRDQDGRPIKLEIECDNGKTFGPQPFLAVKTRSQRFIHDNLNYWTSLNNWNYFFDSESIMPEDVKAVGIASNDSSGNQSIHVIDDIDKCSGPDIIRF